MSPAYKLQLEIIATVAAWKLRFFTLPYKSPYLALGISKSLEIWQAHFWTFIVHECKILQNSGNPCRRHKRLNFSIILRQSVQLLIFSSMFVGYKYLVVSMSGSCFKYSLKPS